MAMDDELQRTVDELAGGRTGPARSNGRQARLVAPSRAEIDTQQGDYDFAKLGETIADSMVHAGEDHVKRANEYLENVRQFADNIRRQIAEKNAELYDMNERLRVFGETVLTAHRNFSDNTALKVPHQPHDPEDDHRPKRQ